MKEDVSMNQVSGSGFLGCQGVWLIHLIIKGNKASIRIKKNLEWLQILSLMTVYGAICWARRYMERNEVNHAVKILESFCRPETALKLGDKILDKSDFCFYIICLV